MIPVCVLQSLITPSLLANVAVVCWLCAESADTRLQGGQEANQPLNLETRDIQRQEHLHSQTHPLPLSLCDAHTQAKVHNRIIARRGDTDDLFGQRGSDWPKVHQLTSQLQLGRSRLSHCLPRVTSRQRDSISNYSMPITAIHSDASRQRCPLMSLKDKAPGVDELHNGRNKTLPAWQNAYDDDDDANTLMIIVQYNVYHTHHHISLACFHLVISSKGKVQLRHVCFGLRCEIPDREPYN